MAATTYATLQTEIIGYTHRVDLATQVPLWIEGGLQRINDELLSWGGIPDQEQIAYTSTVATEETIAVPSDFAALRWIKVENGQRVDPIEPMGYDTMLEVYGNTPGIPAKHDVIDEAFYFRPIPDAVYTIRIAYLKRYASLSAAGDSNYLLTKGGNVLLYAALMESAPWIDDPAKINTWTAGYKEAMTNLRTMARRTRKHRPQEMVLDSALLAIGNPGGQNILTGQ